MEGIEPGGGASRYTMAGSFALSNGTISNTHTDWNNAGGGPLLGSDLTGGSGTIASISTADGRGTMTYTVGDGNVWTMAIYIVSQSQFFIIETDPLALPHTAGEALATSASFTAASFSGYYAMHISGAQAGVSSLILGQLICDGVSALTGTLNTAQSGTANSNSIAGNHAQWWKLAALGGLSFQPNRRHLGIRGRDRQQWLVRRDRAAGVKHSGFRAERIGRIVFIWDRGFVVEYQQLPSGNSGD